MTRTDFNCLAIETATERGSVAVCAGDRRVSTQLTATRNSSRELYQTIRLLMGEIELELSQLDCIAYGMGPGSFTGVRVAVAAAQGLAFALQVPVCGVSTLAALALAAEGGEGGELRAACLDARMGEAYIGVYKLETDGGVAEVTADALVVPDEFRLRTDGAQVRAVGPGWAALPVLLANNAQSVRATDFGVWPTAAAVLRLARDRFARGAAVAPEHALPNYLRDKVTQ